MRVRYYEKTPGNWWLDFKSGDKRHRVPSHCATREEAERKATQIIAEALRGPTAAAAVPKAPRPSKADAAGVSMREAFERALRTRESWITSKAKHTLEQTFTQLGVPETADVAVLTRDYVRKLREAWLKEPGKRTGSTLSPSTVNHRLSMLSTLLEVCDLAPHTVKHLSTKGNRRTRRISDAELAAGQAWLIAEGHRKGALSLAALLTLAVETGAREGELLGLAWEDVRAGTVTFRDTKNSETRTIPLTEAATRVLESRRGLPSPFGDLSGDRITDLWTLMRAGMGLAEDTEFVFHALRHEFASRHVDRGTDAFTLMAMMGHSNITTTQVYVKASLTAMQRAMGISPDAQSLRIVNG